MEMKACSQRPGVQSPSIRAKYEMSWNESGKLQFDQFWEQINISRRDIEIQK